MKNFENYTVCQRFANGFTQWEKRYEDGQTARVCVDNTNCTCALIRSAFKAQESQIDFGQVFTKSEASIFGLDY